MRKSLFLFFLFPFILKSQNTDNRIFDIRQTTPPLSLTECEGSSLLIDSTFYLNFDSISSLKLYAQFKKIEQENINLPNPVSVWLRFKVKNVDSVSLPRFLTMYQRNIERMQLFVVDEKNQVDSSIILGCDFPYGRQTIKTNIPCFYVNLEAQKSYTLYLHIEQKDQFLKTSVNLYKIEDMIRLSDFTEYGFIIGLSFFFVCIALGMFLFMRTPLYLAYFIHTLGSLGYFAATRGIGFAYVWGDFPIFEGVSEVVFACVSFIGFLMLMIYFFETPQYFSKFDKILKAIIIIGLVEIVVGLNRKILPIGIYYASSVAGALSGLVGIVLGGIISIWSYRLFKRKEVFYFLLGFLTFILTAIITILHELGFSSLKYLSHSLMPNLTLFYEFTALLFILAYRIKEEWVKQQLRELQLQQNLAEQRQRISRDLHDEVGSTLTSIGVFSEIALQQVRSNSPQTVPVLNRIGDASRSLIDTINDIVWVISPNNDKFEDVILRMRLFAADLLMTKNVDIDFIVDAQLDNVNLSVEQRKQFYLIFKEAINNIFKYAECSTLKIEIALDGSNIKMSIVDNGKGFDMSNPKNGNGLKTMRERAEILSKGLLSEGGGMVIESQIGKGTIIKMRMPI
jgi:signal transduction histidine kinase